MELVIFFILAAVALAAGVGVIAQHNAARSALFLLVNSTAWRACTSC
jgi:NADH:ubiquinone oxidoreductase subunit 6 (subunit J)